MSLIRYITLACISTLFIACSDDPDWSDTELNMLASFQLSNLDSSAHAISNRFAYSSEAETFGEKIFFDPRFSVNESMSCASCHKPEKAYTDGLARAQGIHRTSRNTPTILGTGYLNWLYWDGRKDSLWSQALVPFEAADEMASSRIRVLRVIHEDEFYRSQYAKLFGPLPAEIFDEKINKNAAPLGDKQARESWRMIPTSTRERISHAFANIGKAIAAYERKLELPETRLDRYLNNLFHQVEPAPELTKNELAGLKLFLDQSKTHCLRCHNGPLFTDSEFHNIGTGKFAGPELDFGRYLGIQVVIQDEFNCLGKYSDADPDQCLALRHLPKQIDGELQGAFKTPTLRYLNKTAPYFHDGRFSTLDEVIDYYLSVQSDTTELPPLNLSVIEKKQLIAFLRIIN